MTYQVRQVRPRRSYWEDCPPPSCHNIIVVCYMLLYFLGLSYICARTVLCPMFGLFRTLSRTGHIARTDWLTWCRSRRGRQAFSNILQLNTVRQSRKKVEHIEVKCFCRPEQPPHISMLLSLIILLWQTDCWLEFDWQWRSLESSVVRGVRCEHNYSSRHCHTTYYTSPAICQHCQLPPSRHSLDQSCQLQRPWSDNMEYGYWQALLRCSSSSSIRSRSVLELYRCLPSSPF